MVDVIYRCAHCKIRCCRRQDDDDKTIDSDGIADESYTATGTPSQMSNYSSDPPRDWDGSQMFS